MVVKDPVATPVLMETPKPDPIPTGFKRTDAGIIPTDWAVSTVGDEFEIQLGKMLDAARNRGMLRPYIGNRAVRWGRFELEDVALVPMTAADIQKYRLRTGDLLVCEGGEIGRAAIWESQLDECYFQKALHRLRSKRGYSAFILMSFLELWSTSGELSNFVTQSSIAHLAKDRLEEVPLPVPPPDEQERIALALSDTDDLLARLDKVIAKKRAVKRAVAQHLVTGSRRLPGFREEWETKTLGSLGTFAKGKGLSKEALSTEGTLAAIPYTAIYTDFDQVIDRSKIRHFTDRLDDTVVIDSPRLLIASSSNMLENIGKATAYYDDAPVAVGGDIIIYETSADIRFLSYLLSTRRHRSRVVLLSQGSTIRHVYASTFSSYEIELPSGPEQAAIITALSDIDAEIVALQQRLDKTRAIRRGMMQALLTGQVRLPTSGHDGVAA